MKKISIISCLLILFLNNTHADVWECLTPENTKLVTQFVKKNGYIIKYMYGQEKTTYDLIKLSQVEVLSCGSGYNDSSETNSIRIKGNAIASWVQSENGCFNPINCTYATYSVDEVLALNYSYVFSADKNKFILVCDLYANYEWTQCKSFNAPSASANGIKDAGYKKIAK